jgi:lyso-ornithine lipid O-acyltransferase
MGSPLRALVRLTGYLSWTLLLLPVQAVAVALDLRLARRLPRFYHRACCRFLGLDLQVRGTMVREKPILFVVNHSSYLDISVMGALLDACFVAKTEVRDWPFFGTLARLQRTVFVDRRPRATRDQRDEIATRLEDGDNLILFPEGTSSDGNRTLPFKSALFSVAEAEVRGVPLTVQPVSVAYTRLDGMPLGRGLRPFYAWYGDMDMASHIWSVAALGKLTIEVEFHPPSTIAAHGGRKELARHCHMLVSNGVARALAGREFPAVAA